MTRAEHYRRAEVLLARANGEDLEFGMLLTAQAQVHATLATAPSLDEPRKRPPVEDLPDVWTPEQKARLRDVLQGQS